MALYILLTLQCYLEATLKLSVFAYFSILFNRFRYIWLLGAFVLCFSRSASLWPSLTLHCYLEANRKLLVFSYFIYVFIYSFIQLYFILFNLFHYIWLLGAFALCFSRSASFADLLRAFTLPSRSASSADLMATVLSESY